MATIKEFSNGKTGVQVYVKVNHRAGSKRPRWANLPPVGYYHEPNGKRLLAWVEIKPDAPVSIPIEHITISAQFDRQEQTTIANRSTTDYQNTYTVTVTHGATSETFDYHGSIEDADNGVVNLSEDNKVFALYCFVQDAISGTMLFKEFKDGYGYDDCCEAHRTWKLCKEATVKAARLGIGDLYALSERLQATYPGVI